MNQHSEIIIVGSGIAGLSAALFLAETFPVRIITKGTILSGSTPLAQGGIAAVSAPDDSFESHIADTQKAGGNTNNRKAVEVMVRSAPTIIEQLHQWGVIFEPEQHLEGGHSFPRIFHCKDQTGKHIAQTLSQKVLHHPNITIQENTALYNINPLTQQVSIQNFSTLSASTISYTALILATGGYSSLFAASSSPAGNTGDAIATAIQSGIHVSDMSLVQFHPTVLKKERSPRLLLTEAIRGNGGKIVRHNGEEIVDPLLPRDTVSSAIAAAEKNGDDVFLEVRHIKNFETQFPYITKVLQEEFGIQPSKELIPITFGAHYCMGGITTDLNGETNISGIYAIGECANTGVHGNNRLASNSLLEGLVFARQCSEQIKTSSAHALPKQQNPKAIPEFIPSNKSTERLFFQHLKTALSQYSSIEKSPQNKANLTTVIQSLTPISTREQNAVTIAQAIADDL